MKELNNLGTKRVSSLGHAPTSSIEDGSTFIKFYEDNQCCNNGSHYSGDKSNGHNSTTTSNLCILGKIVHGCNTNVLSLKRNWRGNECDVVDVEGVFIVTGRVIACDPREVVLNDDLGEDHFELFILYCRNDKSTIMSIRKWPLS